MTAQLHLPPLDLACSDFALNQIALHTYRQAVERTPSEGPRLDTASALLSLQKGCGLSSIGIISLLKKKNVLSNG